MNTNSKRRSFTVGQVLQFLFVLATFTWIGVNVFDASLSSSPCEKAIARLQKMKVEELERFKEAGADGYRFTGELQRPMFVQFKGRCMPSKIWQKLVVRLGNPIVLKYNHSNRWALVYFIQISFKRRLLQGWLTALDRVALSNRVPYPHAPVLH